MADIIPYGRQSINADDIRAVTAALQSQLLTRGPQVSYFEEAIASYCGAKYAAAFNSGSAALHAACFAADVGTKDQLFTTPNTFVATAGAGMMRGAHLQLIDIDRQTGNLDLAKLAAALRKAAGRCVVLPVHFAGIAVDMAALQQIAANLETVVIEDASHAIGSHYPTGERVGSCAFSQMTVFSFHPVKTITTGEGGMVTTNNPRLYEKLCLFRNNGIVRLGPSYYEVVELSNNTHLTEIQAALGLSQLKRLEQFIRKRRQLVGFYRKQLAHLPHIRLFTPDMDEQTAFHLMVVQIDFKALGKSREEVTKQLRDRGIGTQVHYIPLYRHPAFLKLYGDQTAYFPEMELYYANALSLPLFFDLSLDKAAKIAAVLEEIL